MPDFDRNLNPILTNIDTKLPELDNPSSKVNRGGLQGGLSGNSGNALDRFFGSGPVITPMAPTVSARELYENRRYGVYSPDIINIEDQKAYAQSNLDKAVNGLLKGVNLAATTVAGSVGMVYGLAKSPFSGRFADIWDNEIMRELDDWNHRVDNEFLPNYYTDVEKNAAWYSTDNWFKTNFLFDKLIKNSGFAVGAMLSGNIANAGLLRAGRALGGLLAPSAAIAAESAQGFKLFTPLLRNTARVFSNGKNLEAAAILEKEITSIADLTARSSRLAEIAAQTSKFANIGDEGRRLLVAAYSSAAESSFEALQTANEFRNNLIEEYKTVNNGAEPVGRALDEINAKADAVGKTSFFGNLALLSATEFTQLPYLLGSTYRSSKNAANSLLNKVDDVIPKDGKYVTKAAEKTGFGKLYETSRRGLGYVFDPKEAFQEIGQYALQVGTQNYFNKADQTGDASLWVDGFLYGFTGRTEKGEGKGAFVSKEGMESMILGGITGGLMQVTGKFGQSNALATNTQQFISGLDNAPTFREAFKDRLASINRGIVLREQEQQAIVKGDKLEALDLKRDMMHNYLSTRIKYGRFDMVMDDIADLKKEGVTEGGLAALKAQGFANINDTVETFLQRLSTFENVAKSTNEIYNSLNLRFSGITTPDGKKVYTPEVIDKMAYATSKIADYDLRIPQINAQLDEANVETGEVLSSIFKDGESVQEAIDKALGEISNMEIPDTEGLQQNLKDIVELSLRRKMFLNEYNDMKNNPQKYTTPEATAPTETRGEKTKDIIKVTTKDGVKDVEVGETYVAGSKTIETVDGIKLQKFSEFQVIGTNEDGNIVIRTEDGRDMVVKPSTFEEYMLSKKSNMNRAARFYVENSDNKYHFRFKGGKEAIGRIEYDKDTKLLYFVSDELKSNGKPKYKIPVNLEQFQIQEGFNMPQIWTNSKYSPVTNAILNEEETADEKDSRINLENRIAARRQIIKEVHDETKSKIEEIDRKIVSKKEALAKLNEELDTLGQFRVKDKYSNVSIITTWTSVYNRSMRGLTKLAGLKTDLEREISELEAEKEALEFNISHFEDFMQNLREMPEDFYDMMDELSDQIKGLKDLSVSTGKQINQFSKMVDSLEDTMKDLLSLLKTALQKFDSQYPQNIKDKFEELRKAKTVNYADVLGLREMIEDFNFLEDLKKEVSINENTITELRDKITDLYNQISEIEKEQRAKEQILEAFYEAMDKELSRREEENNIQKNEEVISQILGTLNQGIENAPYDREYQPDPRKSLRVINKATIAPSARSFEREGVPPTEHALRANRFGFRLPTLANRADIKGVVVTNDTQAQLIPGLTQFLAQGKPDVKPENTISLVAAIPSKDGKSYTLVDENGEAIPGKSETETDEQYQERLHNSAVFQVFPLSIDNLFPDSASEEARLKLSSKYDEFRKDALENKALVNYNITASFGVPDKVKELDDKGTPKEDYVPVSVVDSGLIKQNDLAENPVLYVPTLEERVSRGSTSFGNALGRVFLRLNNAYVALNNRQHTAKEANTIYQVIHRLSNIIVDENKKGKFVLENSPEAQRLIDWLRTVVYWGSPREGKAAGFNSVWFEKTEDGFKLFMSGKQNDEGKYTPVSEFTPTALEDNRGVITAVLQRMFTNTNSRLTENDSDYNKRYEQITGVNPDGTVESVIWPNYQTYLLSPKQADGKGNRDSKEIPLTTNIRPQEDANDINRNGIYFIINDADFDKKYTDEVPVANPAITAPTAAPESKFDLNGVTENSVKIGDNTIVFTADSKDLAGTIKISDKTDKALIDKLLESQPDREMVMNTLAQFVIGKIKEDQARVAKAAKVPAAPAAPTPPVSTDVRADIERRKEELGLQKVLNIYPPDLSAGGYRIKIKGDKYEVLVQFTGKKWDIFPKQKNGDFQATDPETGDALLINKEQSRKLVEKYLPKKLVDLIEQADSIKEVDDQIKFEQGEIKEYVDLFRKEWLQERIPIEKELLEFYQSDKFDREKESKERIIKAQQEVITKYDAELAALEGVKPVTKAAPSVAPAPVSTGYNLNGTAENTIPISGVDVVFTADEKDLAGTLKLVNVPDSLLENMRKIQQATTGKVDEDVIRNTVAAFVLNELQKAAPKMIPQTPQIPEVTPETQADLDEAWDSTNPTPDDPELRRVLSSDLEKFNAENWPKVEKAIKQIFPNIPVYRVKNIITGTNGEQAWGMYKNGAIYIAENAIMGTALHEIFHPIWQNFTTPEERLLIESEVRSRKGSFVDRKTFQTIEYADATSKQIEELLADELAEYYKDGKFPTEPKKQSLLARIFKQLVDFFKTFFTGENAETNTNKLFDKIGKGYYSKLVMGESELAFAKVGIIDIEDAYITADASLSEIPTFTTKQVNDIMEQMTFLSIGYMQRDGQSLFDIDEGIKKSDIYARVKTNILSKLKGMNEQLKNEAKAGIIAEDTAVQRGMVYREMFNKIMLNWDKLVDAHEIYLKKYGIEFDENDDVNLKSDENTGKGEYDGSHKIDNYRKLNSAVKLVLATLPIIDNNGKPIPSSIGGVNLVPLGEAYISVMNNVHDSLNTEDMLTRIAEMAANDTNYELLYQRLAKTSSENAPDWNAMQKHNIQLLTAFTIAFNKQNPDVKILDILAEGGVQVAEGNLNTATRQITKDFENGIRSVLFNPKNEYFTYNAKDKAYYAKQDAVKGVPVGTPKEKVKFLASLGINFNIDDIINLEVKNPALFERFNIATTGVYKSLLEREKIATITGRTLEIGKRLRTLAAIKARIENPEFPSTFYGVNGEKLQTFIGTNPSNELYKNIAAAPTYESLKGSNGYGYLYTDSFAQNSVVLNAIFNINKETKTGNKRTGGRIAELLKTSLANGTNDQTTGRRKESSRLNQKERYIQEINMNLEGYYYNLVAGDASLEYQTYMGNHVSFEEMRRGYETVSDIFRGYLVDEINLARENRRVAEGRKTNDLRFMNAILGEELSKRILSLEGKAEDIVTNDSIKKKVDAAVEAFIKNETAKFQSALEKYGIVEKLTDDSYSVENLSFSKSGLVNKANLDIHLSTITVNYMIANIEYHKLLYSDPYQYADELKRIKNFLSPRQAILHGSASMNAALNKVWNEEFKPGDYGHTDFTKDSFNSTTLDDVIAMNDIKGYEEFKETDGAGMITFKAHRNFRIRSSNWSAAEERQYRHDVAYKKLVDSGATDKQLDEFEKNNPGVKSAYTPSKPIVAGKKGNKSINDVILDKFALYPLSFRVLNEMDRLAKHGESNAMKLLKKMEVENLDYVVYASARKVGAEELNSVYNDKGEFNTVPYKGIINVPFSILSVQSEVPSKEEDLVTRGSQMTKLLTMDFMDAGVPIDFEKDKTFPERYKMWYDIETEEGRETASPLYKEIKTNQSLLQALTNEGYKIFLKKLGIAEVGGEYVVTDFSKAAKTLRDEILKREANSNIIATLNSFLEGKAILEATPAYQTVRNILYSLADKNFISPKISGGLKVQLPHTLLETVRAKKEGKAYTSDFLKFYEDKDGKRYCEIMVGRWFKSDKTDEELLYYFNETEEGRKQLAALAGVAFRIPTGKQNYIESFRIKRFLPAEYGDAVIVPSALVQKVGSDFDIDKLSVYLKNLYTDGKGNLKLVPYFGIGESARAEFAKMIDSGEFLNKKQMQELDRIIEEEKDILFSPEYDLDGNPVGTDQQKLLRAIFAQAFDDQEITKDFVKNVTKEAFKENLIDKLYKQSLENAYIQSSENLVEREDNYAQLIRPNSAKELEDLSKKITKKLGLPTFDYTDVGNMLDRTFMLRLRHAFVTGKYAIGIAAVAQTNHSLNQREPIIIDPRKLSGLSKVDQYWLGDDPQLKFADGFNTIDIDGNTYVSLSGIKSADEKYISNTIGMFIDGYVDISKGPWIIELGATYNVAGTYLFLVKTGVPVETVAFFMNQPIIRDYLQNLENAGYSYLFNDRMVDEVKGKYKASKEQLAKVTQIPSKGKLFDMIGETKLDEKQKAEQQFILNEFLKYSKLSEQLMAVTQGTNFDTASFNDPFLVFKKEQQLIRARKSVISSPDNILKNSFLGNLRQRINDARNAISKLLISDRKVIRDVLENVLESYTNMYNERDFLAVARKAVNDFFDWAVQIDSDRNSLITKLLLSDDNAPKEVMEFITSIENKPDHPLFTNYIVGKNGIMQHQTPLKNGGVNNLSLKNKDNKVYDQDRVINSFRELREYLKGQNKEILYKKIIGVSILQSGLSTTPFSFTSLLPYEDFSDVYNNVISKLENESDIDLMKFYESKSFQRNNWNNDDIVPSEKARGGYNYMGEYYYNLNMNFDKHPVLSKAMRNGEIPQLLKLSSRSGSAQADVVSYTWDVVPAGKTKTQMMKESDYSFRKRGLFKKVYMDEANKIPVILKEGKYENYVFQMINAWGDSFRANEFYTEPRVSVIDNGFVKVEPTTYTREYTFQDKKYTIEGATSPERSNNYVARYFGAQAAEDVVNSSSIVNALESSNVINKKCNS
jgi:hypothetical protein